MREILYNWFWVVVIEMYVIVKSPTEHLKSVHSIVIYLYLI